jgi:hypothetical protein
VFHVYDKLHLGNVPRRYAIEAGKSYDAKLDVLADNGRYDLWVLGPNGFTARSSATSARRRRPAAAPRPRSGSATTRPTRTSGSR